MPKLRETDDFKKIKRAQRNRKTKERRKKRDKEYKTQAQNAMDIVKAVSDQRKKARHDKV
jgi:hypothetical protein